VAVGLGMQCNDKWGERIRVFHVHAGRQCLFSFDEPITRRPDDPISQFVYNSTIQPMSETPNPEETTSASSGGAMDINQIQALLRHRYPFLLIDRVLELDRMKRVVGLKNVTVNEPFFSGHFPGAPIMPGVLLVECMAQCGAVLLLTEIQDREDKLVFFTGIEKARFRRPVIPGDQLRIEVDVLVWRRINGRMDGKVFVDGKLVAQAIISCALVDRSRSKTSAQTSPADSEPAE